MDTARQSNEVEYRSLVVMIGEEVIFGTEILYGNDPAENGRLFDGALRTIRDAIADPCTPDSAIRKLKTTYAQFCTIRLNYENDLLQGLIVIHDAKAANIRTLSPLTPGTPKENIAFRFTTSILDLNECISNRYAG